MKVIFEPFTSGIEMSLMVRLSVAVSASLIPVRSSAFEIVSDVESSTKSVILAASPERVGLSLTLVTMNELVARVFAWPS